MIGYLGKVSRGSHIKENCSIAAIDGFVWQISQMLTLSVWAALQVNRFKNGIEDRSSENSIPCLGKIGSTANFWVNWMSLAHVIQTGLLIRDWRLFLSPASTNQLSFPIDLPFPLYLPRSRSLRSLATIGEAFRIEGKLKNIWLYSSNFRLGQIPPKGDNNLGVLPLYHCVVWGLPKILVD